MKHTFSQEAFERPQRTIEAVEVVRQHAEMIADACAAAHDQEIVVAVVGPDHTWGGVSTVPAHGLPEQAIDPGSRWEFMFVAHTSRAEVEARCTLIERQAAKRLDALRRWSERQE